jgi:hypothetical protein
MKPDRRSLIAPLGALLLAFGFGGSAHASIIGFNGAWDPVDANGNLINGFAADGGGGSVEATVSGANNSTLTLQFTNTGGPHSIFFENYSNLLPAGTISYNWSVTFGQSANWLLETGIYTDLPANDQLGSFAAGTYSGTATVNYPPGFGNYFSYANIAFGDGAYDATVVLTNFEYTGAATVSAVPLPASLPLFGAGLAGLGMFAWSKARHKRAI